MKKRFGFKTPTCYSQLHIPEAEIRTLPFNEREDGKSNLHRGLPSCHAYLVLIQNVTRYLLPS